MERGCSMIIKVTSLLFLFHLSEQVAEVTEKKVEPTVNSPMWTVFPSAVIAGLGVIFNLLSLSYFIRREHGTLGSKLLMLLNSLDLMVCVTGSIQLGMMVVYWEIPGLAHETFNSLYFVFLEATGFATCLLSVTRCLSLCVPFYKVKQQFVVLAGLVFMGYTVIREVVLVRIVRRETYLEKELLKIHIGLLLAEVGLMILVALTANTISVVKIVLQPEVVKKSRSRSAGVKATTTVLILSGFFCILNTFYLVTEVLYFYCSVRFSQSIVLYFGIFYAVPLNSVMNPLIYLLRKREMRQFLGALVGLCDPPEDTRTSVRTRTLSLVAVTSMSIRSINRSPRLSTTVLRLNSQQGSPIRLGVVLDESVVLKNGNFHVSNRGDMNGNNRVVNHGNK